MVKLPKKKDDPEVLERLATLETHFVWLREKVEKVDQRTWAILAGIIVSILISIALKVI